MDFTILQGTASKVASRLLGCELVRKLNGTTLRGRIIETEAYDQTDAASHTFNGETPRNSVMFGEAGHLYVYFTYGMHYCCNVVTGPIGEGSAVLIRAIEPIEGEDIMLQNCLGRTSLADGPAKLCQTLAIDKTMNGHDLQKSPLKLIINPPLPSETILPAPRIGISQAKDKLWRFIIY